MLENIEIYILLFFIYSFAGWFMESVGGIIKVKKFVNRGFLIGPYCPVYGVGVVFITLLLKNYSQNVLVLFILATAICGILEYLTSYYMEKLFNARWWDYRNNKFNINGRVCLETLIPFGIIGTLILRFMNPIFINYFSGMSDIVRHIITSVLSLSFIIDWIISFRIILSFKGEVNASKDNTEEISEKVKDKAEELGEIVKDKAEDVFMKAESDFIVFGRRLKTKRLRLEREAKRYTRKKLSDSLVLSPKELAERLKVEHEKINIKIAEGKEKINEQMKIKYAEVKLRQEERKHVFYTRVNKRKEELERIQKDSIEKVDNTIKNLKNYSDEVTKQIIENFKKKSILTNRLMEAFPSLSIKIKNKENENKRENK